MARGQNDKNGTEYASNGDFKKFQPRSGNLGHGQLITMPNKKQGSAFSKPQPGSTKEIRNFCFCLLGERSEEKKLLYKQLFFRYAGQAQCRETLARQEILLSVRWTSTAQRKTCFLRNLSFSMLGKQSAEKSLLYKKFDIHYAGRPKRRNKFEPQNVDWQNQMQQLKC